MTISSATSPREIALACGRRIFLRPETIVHALIASFCDLPEADYPGSAAVARECYQKPLRMAAGWGVFGLQTLHWPMLNLLDAAELQRRAFADAMADAVTAVRRGAV